MRHSSFSTSLALTIALSVPAAAQQAGEAPTQSVAPDANAVAATPISEPAPSSPVSQSDALAQPVASTLPPTPASDAPRPAEPAASATGPVLAPPTPPVFEQPNPAAVPAAANTWAPVYTGSFVTRYETRTGYRDLGLERLPRFVEGDAIFYRARFGVGTGLIDTGSAIKVGLQATPQASGVFGILPNTLTDAAFGLHEGYLRVQGNFVRADVGRFELNYGDALVLGNLDWNENGRSFDGARARFSKRPDSMWVDAFTTVLREGRPDGARFADGDVYFMGAYAGLGPAVMKGLDLDAYALARLWPETDGLRLNAATTPVTTYDRKRAGEVTLGARAKQKIDMLDYRVEAGLQAGTRPDAAPSPLPEGGNVQHEVSTVVAYQADLELGVSVIPDKLRISAEGVYASGNDPTTADKNEGWDELYPTAHKWLGLSDAFAQNGIKRTNVASGVLHASATPITNLTVNADGHLFARVEDVNGKSGFAAFELDLGVAYLITKGLKIRGLYALFVPDSDVYAPLPDSGDRDAAQFTEIELRYDM